jgi:hypothetical protein
MTLNIRVGEQLKKSLVRLLGVQQTIELVGVVVTYNMVSRFLVVLNITKEDQST